MAKESLSLREIGRRLEIPPSTISYYKDRFARYIPIAGGQGRRVKYPAEAMILFKEIREMFTRNWSAEQVEDQLSAMQHMATSATVETFAAQAGGDPQRAQAFVHDLAGVLDKMSSVLEAQAHFRTEIDLLRDEVAQLHREKAELISSYEAKILELDVEIERFRRERADLLSRFRDDYCASSGKECMPEEALVVQPLVVHMGGEYLGVAGKGKPFSLRDLIELIQKNAGSQKVLNMDWVHDAGAWKLHVKTQEDAGRGHDYQLRVLSTVTPSGNAVTALKEMTVDGEPVPDKFVLMLFKNVKEGLER